MRKGWYIVGRVTLLLLAAVWLQTTAHALVCHSDNALYGHCDDGGAASECVCICACHAAVEPADALDYRASERTVFVPSVYVNQRGTSIPADIFRPPLANS
jgi:hypothetical protein